jgi:hypothetical protein
LRFDIVTMVREGKPAANLLAAFVGATERRTRKRKQNTKHRQGMLRTTALLRRAAHVLRADGIRSFSSAPRSLVITASGRDRLGVVNDLAKALEASQGNIEESRMTVLGNDFSMVTTSQH